MKKFKKIFAVLLTLAMVLGMGMTSFAADPEDGTIEITGLKANEVVTVNVYKIISLVDNVPNTGKVWEVADGIGEDYVKLEGNQYTIVNKKKSDWDNNVLTEEMKVEALSGEKTADATGKISISGAEAGAYVIMASSVDATYGLMVADVSGYNNGVFYAKGTSITAKTEGYTVTKTAEEGKIFAKRGETIDFTVTTTFPTFEEITENSKYEIIDTPTNLKIDQIKSVKIGSTDVLKELGNIDLNGTSVTIDLSDYISVENAGKTVEVVYAATVTGEEGYSNTAVARRDGDDMGTDTETGFSGSIEVRKIESGQPSNLLSGAEFSVTKVADLVDGEEVAIETPSALKFVKVSDGIYKLALNDSETGTDGQVASATVVATKGTVVVKGLEAGKYHFEETKAPEGYNLAANNGDTKIMEDVTINGDDDSTQKIEMTGNDYPNTRLSSLPGTGGIGTTIFTIGGCAIMIIAAALFFASRRKSAK